MFFFFRTVLFIKAVGKIKNKKYKPPTHPNFSQNLESKDLFGVALSCGRKNRV